MDGMAGCSKPHYFLFLPTSFQRPHSCWCSGMQRNDQGPGCATQIKLFFHFSCIFFNLMLHLDLSGEILSVCQQCSGHVNIFIHILNEVFPHLHDQLDVTACNYILKSFLVKNTELLAIISQVSGSSIWTLIQMQELLLQFLSLRPNKPKQPKVIAWSDLSIRISMHQKAIIRNIWNSKYKNSGGK